MSQVRYNCQAHLVTQKYCSKPAAVTRITSSGDAIHLCKKCDKAYGAVVGTVKS